MSDDGGSLPQRPPRSRRRKTASAEPQDADRKRAHRAVDNAVESSGVQLHALCAEDAADRGASAAATAVAAAPASHGPDIISDNHTSAALRSARVEGYNFEYLDHTADIQLHAWGHNVEAAFEQVALAMLNYMTPLSGIDVNEADSRMYEASGHDMHSLLFSFLDELLFVFSTELFVPAQLSISKFDRSEWCIQASGKGEIFDRQRHAQGTEVKAITYSAMDVREVGDDVEIFVIVDI